MDKRPKCMHAYKQAVNMPTIGQELELIINPLDRWPATTYPTEKSSISSAIL